MLALALRNLWRNKIRTAITLAAISGGLAMMLMSNNLNHGMYQDLIRTGISTIAGHVVVQPEGWREDPDAVERSVANADQVAEALQGAWPEATVVQRSFLGGLLNSPSSSAGVALTAVQPELEKTVSDWHEKVIEGAWLEADDHRGILLGVKLAETLGLGLGEKVVLMGQGKEDINSRLFRVRGLVRSGSTLVDGTLAFISVGAAQEFLEQAGAVSQVSLHLGSADASDEALAAAKTALAGTPGVEILGWKEAVSDLWEFTRTDRRTNHSFMLFIGLIVALGIINTILMSVMERIREFGVMLALGVPPRRLRSMILTEGLLLGLFGSALGLIFGSLVTVYLVKEGIDYSEMVGDSFDISGVALGTQIRAAWDWSTMALYAVIAVFLSVLATVYPAWKAGKLRPVDAMRHV